MSVNTTVSIRVDPPIRADGDFYRELDTILMSESMVPRTSVWGYTDDYDDLTLQVHERAQAWGKGYTLITEYGLVDREFRIEVTVHYSGQSLVEKIFLSSREVRAYLKFYDEEERCNALALQDIAIRMHQQFGATETKAVEDFHDHPWFHFSSDVWQPIKRLFAREDKSSFSLGFRRKPVSAEDFYHRLDVCLLDCAFRPLHIWARHSGRIRYRDWQDRLSAHANGESVELVFQHETLDNAFVDVLVLQDGGESQISGLSIEVYLCKRELGIVRVQQILKRLSGALQNTFKQSIRTD